MNKQLMMIIKSKVETYFMINKSLSDKEKIQYCEGILKDIHEFSGRAK